MVSAESRVWGALPVFSEAQAQAFSRLAALGGFGALPLEVLGVRCEARWRPALPRYPVTFHLQTAAGRVRIGCDLGALWPELAADGLREMLAAPADGALEALEGGSPDDPSVLVFLLGEWIDLLERVLGETPTLRRVCFDQAWPRAHWAVRVVDAQGHSGTVAFAGQAICDALVDGVAAAPQRYTRFAQVPLTLSWRVAAPTLAFEQLATLVEHAVLLLDEQPVELCLPGRHGRICLRGYEQQGEFMVTGVDLKTDAHFQANPVETGLVPLDMIMASIDVLLDTLVMPLSDIVSLAPGSVLSLSQLQTGRAVTLRCNGAPFARGEVIAVGQRLGVLITQKAGVIDAPVEAVPEETPAPAPARRRPPARRASAAARQPATSTLVSGAASEADDFDDDDGLEAHHG